MNAHGAVIAPKTIASALLSVAFLLGFFWLQSQANDDILKINRIAARQVQLNQLASQLVSDLHVYSTLVRHRFYERNDYKAPSSGLDKSLKAISADFVRSDIERHLFDKLALKMALFERFNDLGIRIHDGDYRQDLVQPLFKGTVDEVVDLLLMGATANANSLEVVRAAADLFGHLNHNIESEIDLLSEQILSTRQYAYLLFMFFLAALFAVIYFYKQQVRQSEERHQALLSLAQQKQDAERVSHYRSTFLSNLSLKLRSPMNGLLGAIQLMDQEDDSYQLQRLQHIAMSSFRSLRVIVDDVLDLSQLESGKFTLNEVPLSLADMLAGVVDEYRSQADARNNKIELIVAESITDHAWLGDAMRLNQIFRNLLSNAVKFTEGGLISVRAEVDERSDVVVEVADSGVGMSDVQLTHLFTLFDSTNGTSLSEFGDTELGLAVTNALVTRMSGSIEVGSEIGVGSTFTLRLPLVTCDERLHEVYAGRDLSDDVLKAKRVLYADDVVTNRLVMQLGLEQFGAVVFAVQSGEKALAEFLRIQPHAAVLDLHSENRAAIDVAKKLKSMAPEIPLVVVTGDVSEAMLSTCQACGVDAVLTKPLDYKELGRVLGKMLSRT